MKRTLAIILSACMLFALISCDFDSLLDETTTKKEVASDTTTAEETTKKPQPLNNKNVTIEEQVLMEYDGFKVTAKSFDDGLLGPNVKILIENNTDKNITLISREIIVNDYMIDSSVYCDVAAGKNANKTISFKNTDLKEAGIAAIGKIELYLYISDAELLTDIFISDCITIKTSVFDDIEIVKQNEGEELLNKDGLRIFGYYSDKDSYFGRSIELFVDNNTNQDITVLIEDFSINGYMVSATLFCDVFSERMILDEIPILNAYLENNNITKINNVEFKFKVVSYGDYETLFKSDTITINVN